MDLILHNTLTRKREVFTPQDPARVTMYACGPTVYNYAHIGNARPAVLFDLLAGVLRRRYAGVLYARNITDVDDKINASAQELGVPIEVITDRFTQAYHEDMAALGVQRPDLEPRATRTMDTIIAMTERLVASGHAYAAEGHVLFAVSRFAGYGKLSGRTADEQLAGARIEVESYKRDPGDFVLWKPSTPELPGWNSPWGRGRPGWHIECSAMTERFLGETIDIHAGGNDLLFPHHENEIAQSECAHGGRPFARYWVHNGFVTMSGRKMSKSLGNTLLVRDLREQVPPEALRFLLLNAHYRQPLDWSDSALDQAVRTLDRVYGVLRDLAGTATDAAPVPESLEAALCDDLNTPVALAEISRLAGDARRAEGPAAQAAAKSALLGAGAALGLLQQAPEAWFSQRAASNEALDEGKVQDLVARRDAAKAARDFARADAIRAELGAMGVVLEDTPQGVRWRRAKSDEAALAR